MNVHLPVWKTSPFIRIIPSFIAGIILEWYADISLWHIIFTSLFPVLFIFFLSLAPIHKQYRFRLINGIGISWLLFLFGMLITYQANLKEDKNWFAHHLQKNDRLLLRLTEPPLERNKTWKCVAETEAIVNTHSKNVKGKLIIYFQKTDSFTLQYGDRILVNADMAPVTNSGNPGSFDYARYMKLHGVFHQLYVKAGGYILVDSRPSSFQKFIYELRDRAVNIIQQNISGKDHIGVAEALIIGYKEELDKDLVQAYSNAGVVHIISISGLHLGLVYILLMWIMARMPYLKNKKIFQWCIIIIGLWLFACVTGCPPSALRSAVMFSFIITGKTFFKQHATYNALCSSAFILLCFDPNYLWDVGFQLSYVAVFGIVWLQQPVQKLFYFNNKYLQKLWGLLSVTLAAQLITSPLCVYYFHQFPNLFLVTNIVAVPASTAILFGGILLLCVSPLSFLADIVGKCVGFIIELMNRFILFVNDFSFSVTDHLSLSLVSAWMLYGIIICASIAFFYQYKKMVLPALFCLMIFSADILIKKMEVSKQHKLIVYNIPKKSAVQFIQKNRSQLFADSAIIHSEMLSSFHIKPAAIQFGVSETEKISSFSNQLYLFNNKLILQLRHKPFLTKNIQTDIIILSDNVWVKFNELSILKPSLIIFDASNSLWKIEQWKTECEKLHLRYYSVPSSGAYISDH